MSVPFLDLARQHDSLRSEIEAAIRRVLDSGQFILGEETAALEAEVAAACGVNHAVAVASGTDGLYLALRALGVGSGHEVVTTAFSFIATATSVARAGARPVFADIDPDTFNLDPAAAEAALTPATKAILPVDLYGACASWERFEEIASRRGVSLVEDAAQAIGASSRGRRAGAFGDAASISFYPTKNLGGMGDGGMVTTGSDEVARAVRLLRTHGDTGGYRHEALGVNSRMDAFQAAVLRVKMSRLGDWNRERRSLAALYTAALGASFGAGAGGREQGSPVKVPAAPAEGEEPVWHQYVIRADRRDELAEHLKQRGIGCGIYYPVPLHLQACFRYLGCAEGSLPQTERACREVLALPIYPGLTGGEVSRVCEAVSAFYGVPA